MQIILLWKMQPCLYFCMINLMQYTSDSFESIIVSVNVKVMYFSNVQRFLFAHLRTFHKVLVMTPVHMKITIFVKKKIHFQIFFAGLKENSYVYLFFPEEDISPNDIGPHKSFNIPGTVSQPSSGSHPTNRQTDGEVLGKLQELYNERWVQRMSHT